MEPDMTQNASIALVTGANKGIGFDTAKQLAARGMTVLLAARTQEKADDAAKKIQGNVVPVALEVTDEKQRKQLAARIEKEFGRLDVLVNNAGVALEHGLRPSQSTQEILHAIYETNFFAAIALTQQLLPLIRKSTAGRIVNVTSRLGSVSLNAAAPAKGWFDELGYNSSKAALNMFTILLAKELEGTAIKINSAHPGWVKTDMGGANAPLELEDGAKTSVWLATLPADGPTGGFFHMQEPLPW